MTTQSSTPLVTLKLLNKEYGQFTAVNHINLEIEKGEFLTFLGSSGSGKSTTLSMIAGFETPTSGEILLHNNSLIHVPSHKRGIGMVFQHYSLFPHMNVRDNIGFPLDIRKVPKPERDKKVDEILKLVQLSDFADRRPNMLSGGQKQRVAIARALVYEPEILLMDEPLGALDKKLREDLQDELRQIHRRLGITIIYVTHDQDEAMRLSERIAIFKDGEIVGLGSGTELYNTPPNAFVASFLGNSNFLKVRIKSESQAQFEQQLLTLGTQSHRIPDQTDVLLMIRPENIYVLPKEQAAQEPLAADMNEILATVEETVFLGESYTCTLVTQSGQRLMGKAVAREHTDVTAGSEVCVRWSTQHSCVYEQWSEQDIMKAS
ncbi:polyamine ABC transporter ATP-binding protein [Marinomonas piezotolerans]|uniref:Polyamine ABC transporter ATP-binding protein n=1 Tax=Marinomonas piezotolerans TaxID=2213058 RepID=A0A370UCU1_9GAMM|nr:ABC transporter ATP-binding protein [Marinomonas piezotolerans]RDL45569.1 polyamine ABC transporter ATP-binding protein [Marinomonas piezotolerans]